MPSFWVVEKLAVIEYLIPRIVARAEYLSLDHLCFQAREEAFSDCIVMAVISTDHAEFQVIILHERSPIRERILNTLI